MKTLVTGSNGFIGSYVRAELEARGQECVPFDLPQSVTDKDAVRKAVRGVDGVIHLAGMLGTSETFTDLVNVFETNVSGALNVAEACFRNDIPMVQIGTGHKGQPNPYALSKGLAEDLLITQHGDDVDENLDVNIVRAYHAYGPGQKAGPPYGISVVRKMVPTFICDALAGQPIEIFGTGEQVIDLVYAGDVAKVLIDGLSAPYGRRLEAGTGVGITVNQAAAEILKFTGTVPINYVGKRAGEPLDAVVVAAEPLCPHPFPYQLEETVDYYRYLVAATL